MATKLSKKSGNADPMGIIVSLVSATCLVVSLFAAGFAACTASQATRAFSASFCNDQVSPYLHDDLVELAVATRDYTVDDSGRADSGTQAAREAFCDLLMESAQHSTADGSPNLDRWDAQALAVLQEAEDGGYASSVEAAYALADAGEAYGLSDDAFSHLDDCYSIIGPARGYLGIVASTALVLVGLLTITGRHRLAGNVLFFSPIILLAFMAVCGIWAAVDFNGFFSVFHSLLFPQGNWTFPYDSLLICMLPLNFWVSMAALWLAVTVLACIIAMLVGRRFRKSSRRA